MRRWTLHNHATPIVQFYIAETSYMLLKSDPYTVVTSDPLYSTIDNVDGVVDDKEGVSDVFVSSKVGRGSINSVNFSAA